MKPKGHHPFPLVHIALLIAILIAFGMTILAGYKFYTLSKDLDLALQTNASSTEMLNRITLALASSTQDNATLLSNLQAEQARNDNFASQINGLSSTVGVLDKLSKTDKELLQKYSNVFFLNENYVPSSLTLVDSQYLANIDKPAQVHTKVKSYLQSMLSAANASGAPLQILSAYRSFGTQSDLKSTYKITYGAGTANSFSADQGYSEHQLGTTLDFTTQAIGGTLSGFDKTPQYSWLVANAYQYGFILSYPKGNKYFTYEPWHWRFVGVALATYLHNNNKYFYDLDQREIDQYLVNIFD